ncbi:penicillin acylase family protein [bacterium]|nr:MAG: penicillin acylase family protein [bacterium]
MMRTLRASGAGLGVLILLAALALAAWFLSWSRFAPLPQRSGRLVLPGLHAAVSVRRDARGIPYVRAGSLHDVYEAQGYLEGQARLFQMDVLRRFVGGRLAEIFGKGALGVDIVHRDIGGAALAQAIYDRAAPPERLALDAYAQGVNAAIARGPLPPEFKVLLYRPAPWRPQDSILCGLATVIDLTHAWNQIALRQAIDVALGAQAAQALYPITDPAYDAPLLGRPAPVTAMPPLRAAGSARGGGDALRIALRLPRAAALEASNEWAVGGAQTRAGRALLANDPHLDYTVPMVWYALALRAPGLDAVGVSLPGTPGIILGHNAHIAWGATNGTVSTVTLYRERVGRDARGDPTYLDPQTRRWVPMGARVERIAVRAGRAVVFTRRSTRHGFIVVDGSGTPTPYAAAWVAERDPRSPLEPFLRLDRAATLEEALDILRRYPGPPQNFVLADDRGRVAYHLAGSIPDDGVWGTRAVDGSRVVDAWRGYVPFDALPHVAPSRTAIVFTANNRMYGAGYRYRLTDAFGPPYRAARIRALLHARGLVTVRAMERLQLDDYSAPELELVRDALAAVRRHPRAAGNVRDQRLLERWEGRFDGSSRAATLAFDLRVAAERDFAVAVLGPALGQAWLDDAGALALVPLLRALRERPRGWFADGDGDGLLLRALREAEAAAGAVPPAWGSAGATPLHHPLAKLGMTLFDPGVIPGWGDAYTVKVQTPVYGQSFRAVWEPGAWDRGGMTLPLGESGRPRSPHYRDLLQSWTAGALAPLTLDGPAAAASASSALLLVPAS